MHGTRNNTPRESIRTVIVKSFCECIMRAAGKFFKFNVGSVSWISFIKV